MSAGDYHRFACALSGMLGRSALSDDELAFLRRRAWREQSLLIVSPFDERLFTEESRQLRRIGEKLYGRGIGQ